MKMFLTAVIKNEHTSNDSLQSDSSFLLRNSLMTTLPAGESLKFSFLHAVYTGSSHGSVRLNSCNMALKFSAIMYITTRRHYSSLEIETNNAKYRRIDF